MNRTPRARELCRTVDRVLARERMTAVEAQAIAAGALAILAEATGLDDAQTEAMAIEILEDVRAARRLDIPPPRVRLRRT